MSCLNQKLVIIFLTTLLLVFSASLPLTEIDSDLDLTAEQSTEGSGEVENTNKTQSLYVVKAVVYEIGILTDDDESDSFSEDETQERVDLTFFDAHKNSSHINLGNIPLPVQTNVSGQVLTGIAPINIGAFSTPAELLRSLPFTGTIVNITHSDTAFFRLSEKNGSTAFSDELLGSEPTSILKFQKPIQQLDDD